MTDAVRTEEFPPPPDLGGQIASSDVSVERTSLGLFDQGASTADRLFVLGYAATIFLSAFLLFQVQPLASKAILPWFGGAPAVWTTAMLVFQALLFAGYFYAFLMRDFGARTRTIVHLALLAIALVALPILPGDVWKPDDVERPVLQIVTILLVCVGLPFFVLSTSGPLLQDWFRRTHPDRSPYRLYALSNAGSLLALLSYPFLIEPAFSLPAQSWIWSASFGLFALLCATLGIAAMRVQTKSLLPSTALPSGATGSASARTSMVRSTVGALAEPVAPEKTKPVSIGRVLLWFFLGAVPSAMLLATTNQVCLDVAAVPFLWVVPLSLYLLTFVICFDAPKRYSRTLALTGVLLSTLAMTMAFVGAQNASIGFQATAFFAGLFACAYFCHGELARLKPEPARLTTFYLVVAGAGLAGGAFVSLLAPAIFTTFLEIHLAIAATLALGLVILFRDAHVPKAPRPDLAKFAEGFSPVRSTRKSAAPPTVDGMTWMWGLLFSGDLMVVLFIGFQTAGVAHPDLLDSQRNFFGVLRVRTKNVERPDEALLEMLHGRIAHGSQFLKKGRERTPTYYYGPTSGVGLALRHHRAEEPRRLAVAGLGAGTLAVYGKPGDAMRFYEINPAVVELAEARFVYLPTCEAKWDVVVADARLALEREAAASEAPFDVLILDAFSGDSIPTHLLTEEAFATYLARLTPAGILAVHISNRHFDLAPVLAASATKYDLASRVVETTGDTYGATAALWILLSPEEATFDGAAFDGLPQLDVSDPIAWTDRRCDLFSTLRPISWSEFFFARTIDEAFAAKLKIGEEAMRDGDFAAAETALREAIAIHDSHVATRIALGVTLEKLSKTDSAIAEFEKALELDPASAEAARRLGNAIGMHDPDRAEGLLRKSLELDNRDPHACVALADLLVARGQIDEAKTLYRKAVAIDPRQYQAEATLEKLDAAASPATE